MSEWKKFKVGTPAIKGFSSNCFPFDSVSHTSHVASSISILQAKEIRPSLVFDESILNTKRILVSWLSPNHWSPGFRYGNVKFEFSFNDLIKNKRYYWVEAIAYSIKACRILITDINHDADLPQYDPTVREGPWWFDKVNNIHYYNNDHCLEFMIEDSVDLTNMKQISFVDHHKNYCALHRKTPKNCVELGLPSKKGGAIFLTRVAAAKLEFPELAMHFVNDDGKPNFDLKNSFSDFAFRVSRKVEFTGHLTEKSELSIPVARSIMSAFTNGLIDEAKLLCNMFSDEISFANVSAKLFADTVGLEEWKELLDD